MWRDDNEKLDRGGIWIWCSKCKHFSHFSIKIPEWWNNCNDISPENLTSIPINLEKKKKLIVMHIKKIYSLK